MEHKLYNKIVFVCLIAFGINFNSSAENRWDSYISTIKAELNDDYPLYDHWIDGHFEIGARLSSYKFDRTHESSKDDKYFIGSNNRIEEQDRDFGLHNLKITWFPFSKPEQWLKKSKKSEWDLFFSLLQKTGIELTWDELQAKAITSANSNHPQYSDGTVIVKGPMLSCLINMENSTPVTPYFGLGLAIYNDTSVTGGWWHLGFQSEDAYRQWVEAGSNGNPSGGYRRTFTVDEDWGTFWYIGAAIEIYENWNVDIFYRDTNIEFDNKYTMSRGDRVLDSRHSKWDLSNKTYGIGVKYTY